jgi:hypothetical protein
LSRSHPLDLENKRGLPHKDYFHYLSCALSLKLIHTSSTRLVLLLETQRFFENPPAHSLRSSYLRLFQHLSKCWPCSLLTRVFLILYTLLSIHALLALTQRNSLYIFWAIKSEHDSSFTLFAWLLCTLCTSVSEEKQLKLIENYRFIHSIMKFKHRYIKYTQKNKNITQLTHRYKTQRFETNSSYIIFKTQQNIYKIYCSS